MIPVHNEPLSIRSTINIIVKHISTNDEVLIVYDNDDDTTIPVFNRFFKKQKNVNIIKNKIAKGPSGAIRTGLLASKGKYIIVTMADLCDNFPQAIKIITNSKDKAVDIFSFSRFMKGSEITLQEKHFQFKLRYFKHKLKIILPRIASNLLQFFGGLPLTDPTNSFKVYSSDLLKKLDLKSETSFSVTLEIVMKAHLLNAEMLEVPTEWQDRKFGVSNFPLVKSMIAYLPWFFLIVYKNKLFVINKIPFRK